MTDHTDDIDWQLLVRWLAGECTADEDAAVRHRISADPEIRATVAALRKAMDLGDPVPTDWDSRRGWARMQEAAGITPRPRLKPPLQLVEPGPERKRKHHLGRRRPLARWLAAAAVIVAVGGAVLLERAVDWRRAPAGSTAFRELTTARGQRMEFRLDDGTRVALSPMSRIRIPSDYGAAERRVDLDGEAYFDVVHDDARPFRVRARHAEALDLGTRFTVRSREGDAAVRVVVAEGQVALGTAAASDSGTLLSRGELGRLDTAGVATVVRDVDIDSYLAWTRGRLVFDGATLGEAAAELSRWYDIDITLDAPALADREFSLTFQSESLDQVLDAVAFVAHARYERTGRSVTFYPVQRSTP